MKPVLIRLAEAVQRAVGVEHGPVCPAFVPPAPRGATVLGELTVEQQFMFMEMNKISEETEAAVRRAKEAVERHELAKKVFYDAVQTGLKIDREKMPNLGIGARWQVYGKEGNGHDVDDMLGGDGDLDLSQIFGGRGSHPLEVLLRRAGSRPRDHAHA